MATGETRTINSDLALTNRYEMTRYDDILNIINATITLSKPAGDLFTNEGNDTVSITGSTITATAKGLSFLLGSGEDTLILQDTVIDAPMMTGSGDDTVIISGGKQNSVTLKSTLDTDEYTLNLGSGNDILEIRSVLYGDGSIYFGSEQETLRFNGGSLMTTGSFGTFNILDVTVAGGVTGRDLNLSGTQTQLIFNGSLFGSESGKMINIISDTPAVTTLTTADNIRTDVTWNLSNITLTQSDSGTLEFSEHTGYAITANNSNVTLHDIVTEYGQAFSGSNTNWKIQDSNFSNSTIGAAKLLNGNKLTGADLAFSNNQGGGAIYAADTEMDISKLMLNGNANVCSASASATGDDGDGAYWYYTSYSRLVDTVALGGGIYGSNDIINITSGNISANSVTATSFAGYSAYYGELSVPTLLTAYATACGGGIGNCGGKLTLMSASFAKNSAVGSASASVVCDTHSSANLNNSKTYTTSFAYGGGLYQSSGNLNVADTVFNSNAVYGMTSADILVSYSTLNCNRYNHWMEARAAGGACAIVNSVADLENTKFYNNIASASIPNMTSSMYKDSWPYWHLSYISYGGALYLSNSTMNYTVTSGTKFTNTGNQADYGGWLYLSTNSIANLIVEDNAVLTIGDSTDKDSIGDDGTGIIQKQGNGYLLVNSSISDYTGVWTIYGGTVELARIARTITLDSWTFGENGKLILSSLDDTVNMTANKKISILDLGGGSDVINTNGYALSNGTLRISKLKFTGGGRISSTITNRDADTGFDLTLDDVVLNSDITGGSAIDQIAITKDSTLGGIINLGDGDNIITATAAATFQKSLKTGRGNDSFTFTTVNFEDEVDFGNGNNTLSAINAQIKSAITAGNGNDTFTFGNSSDNTGSLVAYDTINLGNGVNTLTAYCIADVKNIVGGNGDDTVDFYKASTINGELSLGEGKNVVYVEDSLTMTNGAVKMTENGETRIVVYRGTTLTDNTLTVYSDVNAERETATYSWANQTDLDKVRLIVSRDSTFETFEFAVELYNKSKSFTLNLEKGYFVQFQANDEDGWKQRLLDDTTAPNQVTGVVFNGKQLVWEATHDNLGGNGVQQYTIEIATDSNFTNVTNTCTVTKTEYTPTGLGNGNYYFRVRAEDYTQNIGQWSTVVSGQMDGTAPTRPSGGRSTVSGYNVNLSWNASTDTGSGVATYEYRIASDSSYSKIVRNDTVSGLSADISGLAYGTYYWQVRAIDNAGNIGDWSLSKSVKTQDNVAPDAPINLDYGVEEGSVAVVWDASDDDTLGSGLKGYTIQISKDSSFSTIAKSIDVTGTEAFISGLAGGDYFLRVSASDNANNQSAWSDILSFAIESSDVTPPTVPADLSATVQKQNVTFAWSAGTDDQSDVVYYELQTAQNAYFSDAVTLSVESTSTTVNLEDGTYYWRVRTVDQAGNTSAYVSGQIIHVDTIAPNKPTASANITTATNQDVTVTASFSTDSVKKEYSLDNQNWSTYTTGIKFSSNGTVYFRGTDAAGNVSAVTSYAVTNIDKVAPNKPTASANITSVTNQDVTITATFSTDSVKKEYSLDNQNWSTYTTGIKFSANGTVYLRGTDAAGNVSAVTSYAVTNIDKVAPNKPTASANITSVTNQDVTITATFSTDSVKKEYSLDNQNWSTYTTGIKFSANGTVYLRGTDAAGNVSAVTSYAVTNIDKVAPTINNHVINQGINNYIFTATVNATDNLTSAENLTYSIKYATTSAGLSSAIVSSGLSFTLSVADAGKTMYYQVGVTDKAGNTTWSQSTSFTVINTSAPEDYARFVATLSNPITLISGTTYTNPEIYADNGGAGEVQTGGILNASTVNFIGNTAATFGGAIYNSGIATISSSILNENVAPTGGVIYNCGTATITDSTFKSNSGATGGAVYNDGTIAISGSTFSGNSAECYGGAFFNDVGTGVISKSVFIENTASKEGGAINNCFYGPVTIIDSIFIRNSAKGNGGAIHNNAKLLISGSTFSESYSPYGGAIYNYGTMAIINSIFVGNSAGIYGAAFSNYGNMTISGSTFGKNNASTGGAIYNYSNATISNSLFCDNTAAGRGGAFFIHGYGITNFSNSIFSNNTAGTFGGAIYNQNKAIISNSTFSGNSALKAGAIYNSNVTTTINKSMFSNNIAEIFGGAIYNKWNTVTACDSIFISNNAGTSGGAIYNDGTATIYNSTFTENIAEKFGGAIYNSVAVTISGLTFQGNTASTGGAIYNAGTSSKINMIGEVTLQTESDTIYNEGILSWNLSNGTASYGKIVNYQYLTNVGSLTITVSANQTCGNYVIATGDFSSVTGKDTFCITGVSGKTDTTIRINGDILSYNSINYKLAVFGNNLILSVGTEIPTPNTRFIATTTTPVMLISGTTYTNPEIYVGNGAAGEVQAGGVLNASMVSFIGNTATTCGGAIYNNGTVTIGDSAFSSNSASRGGAIYNGDNLIFSSSIFSGNNASSGGVLYNNAGTIAISDSTFSDNSADRFGGAIYNGDNTETVSNSMFSRNKSSYGGAIYNTDIIKASSSIFSENRASNYGGAIYNSKGTTTIADSVLKENSASRGGAIYNRNNVTINSSTFSGNSASSGGAVYNFTGDISVIHSTFSNNTADEGSAIYNIGTMTIEDVTFDGNIAGANGGAIVNYGTMSLHNVYFKTVNDTVQTSGDMSLSGIISIAGNFNVDVEGTVIANQADIILNLQAYSVPNATELISNISGISGTADWFITVNADQQEGTYRLASGVTDSYEMTLQLDTGYEIGKISLATPLKLFDMNYTLQCADSVLSLVLTRDNPVYVNAAWSGYAKGKVVSVSGGTAVIGTNAFANESSAIATVGTQTHLTMLGTQSGNMTLSGDNLGIEDMIVSGTVYAGEATDTPEDKNIMISGTTAARALVCGNFNCVNQNMEDDSSQDYAKALAVISGSTFAKGLFAGDAKDSVIFANTDISMSESAGNLLFGGLNITAGSSADAANAVAINGDSVITLNDSVSTQYTNGGSLIASYSNETRSGNLTLNIVGGTHKQVVGGSLIQSNSGVAEEVLFSQITGNINISVSGNAKIGALYGGSMALKVGATRKESISGNIGITIDVSEGAAVSGMVFCGGAAYMSVDGDTNLTVKGAGKGSDFFGATVISCDSAYANWGSRYVSGDRSLSFSNFNGRCQSNIYLVDTINVDATSEVTLTYLMSNLNGVNWNIAADDADRVSVTLAESTLGEFSVDLAGSAMNLSCELGDGDEWTVFKSASSEVFLNLGNADIYLNGDFLTETDTNLMTGETYQLEYREDGTLVASKLA